MNGEGIERDDAEAASWFTRAANQGFVRAQRILGQMYLTGTGVPKDLVKGYAWVVLAGRRGAPSQGAGSLPLSPQQLAQAEEVMGRWERNRSHPYLVWPIPRFWGYVRMVGN